MQFTFTSHAKVEIARRQLDIAQVEDVASNPGQIVLQEAKRQVMQSLIEGKEGKIYLLRVIVDLSSMPPSIITAYRTSNIAKYWRKV